MNSAFRAISASPISRVRPGTKKRVDCELPRSGSECGKPASPILGDNRAAAIVDIQLGKLHGNRPPHRCKPTQKGQEPVTEAPRQWIVQASPAVSADPTFQHRDGNRPAPELYESSKTSRPKPRITRASFQVRLKASWMPVFIPCPPAGLCRCAASPATKQRPSGKS